MQDHIIDVLRRVYVCWFGCDDTITLPKPWGPITLMIPSKNPFEEMMCAFVVL